MGMGVEIASNHLKIFPKGNQKGVPITPEPTLTWAAPGIPIPKHKSMDRLLEDLGKDSIRNTMLEHENTFKEQVYELHRLYKVQKILMNELNRRQSRLNPVTTKPSFWSNHSPPFRDAPGSTAAQLKAEEEDPFHPDGCSKGLAIDAGETFRFRGGINLDLGGKESPGGSFSSTEERPRSMDLQPFESEESDLDLTLGIGSGSSRQKARPRPCSNLTGERTGGHEVNLASEGVQQHTWLFQTLRLDRS